MASSCGGGGCQGDGSGCNSKNAPQKIQNGASSVPLICTKCSAYAASVLAQPRQALCQQCLLSMIDLKIRNLVRGRGLIRDGDSIAVAFSGGPSSSMLLHFLANIKAPTTAANSNSVHQHPDKGRVRFTLHIIHAAQLEDTKQQQSLHDDKIYGAANAALQSSTITPGIHIGREADVYFHTVNLAALFDVTTYSENNGGPTKVHSSTPTSSQQKQNQLSQLVCTIKDATGREDILSHLTCHLLVQTATHLGCSKLLRADTSTRLAVKTIAAVSKGQGYSLPAEAGCMADLRFPKYLDPRAPIIMYPMRDVGMKHVALAAHYLKLPTVHSSLPEVVAKMMISNSNDGTAINCSRLNSSSHPTSINIFAEGFVAGLQEQNPGAVGNVLSVVARLTKFPWTDPPLLIERETKKKKEKESGTDDCDTTKKAYIDNAALWLNGDGSSDPVCTLCFNPFTLDKEIQGAPSFCSTCQVQILGERQGSSGCSIGEKGLNSIINMLPPAMVMDGDDDNIKGRRRRRMRKMTEDEMRNMLGDCILTD